MELEARQEKTSPPLWQRLLVGKRPARTLARIIIFIAAVFILFRFVVVPIRVTGDSMFPTYKNGQINLVNRFSYRSHLPQRGDVVAVEFAPKILLLKRIVGMPGETVHILGGVIYVNGEPLSEPYKNGQIPWSLKPQELEPNQYLVIGDNRPVSDLHLKYNYQIVGRVIF